MQWLWKISWQNCNKFGDYKVRQQYKIISKSNYLLGNSGDYTSLVLLYDCLGVTCVVSDSNWTDNIETHVITEHCTVGSLVQRFNSKALHLP